MKLALGTAQFGMDYGINNKRGQIKKEEVHSILEFAYGKGIDRLDTAHSYGNSEKRIGAFIKEKNNKFKIISKLSANYKYPEKSVDQSLKRLNSDRIYAYLIHDFNSFLKRPKIWNELKELKKRGKIKKIGFSLYYPKEIEDILRRNIEIDIVQIPFSIFDQRFSKIFPSLKKKGVEIHVRSVFLQGLVFKNPEELKGKFIKIKDKVSKLRSISEEVNVSLASLCINFAVLNKYIDKVIIGVDSIQNLKQNIEALNFQDKIKKIYDRLFELRCDDEDVIVPTNWKKRMLK